MAEQCQVCGSSADTTFSVGVQKVTQSGVMKYYQNASVPVPCCTACKQSELSKIRGNAGLALGVVAVLTIVGAIAGRFAGAFAGFAIGFFVFLIVGASKKPSLLGNHPNVQEYIRQGYRVNYP